MRSINFLLTYLLTYLLVEKPVYDFLFVIIELLPVCDSKLSKRRAVSVL